MSKQHLLAAGLLTPILAFAATPSDQDIIEQIIVTAQKRETALQDVPFSVGAATEQQIRNTGSTNIVDLARNMAGLTITDLGPGQSQVAIRGISAGQVVRDLVGGVKESVGVYLDESPISQSLFTPDLDLFDLQRFEVLRGPQGTLFGAGSSAGTVRYITNQPKLGTFEGAAEANGFQGSDTEFGGGIKGAVNLPMGDKTALRVVGYYDQLAGFIDSVYPGRATKQDVNGGEKYGGRIALLWQLTDNISITPRFVYQKLETDGYPRIDYYNILGNPYTTTEPPVTPGDRGQVTQLKEGLNDEVKLGDLKFEWVLGGVTLTSITSYTKRDVVVTRDASQLTGSVTYGSFGGNSAETRLNSPLIDTTNLKLWSEELRLASGGGGAFDWLVGGFYQHIDRTYGQNLPTPGYDALLESRGIPPSSFFGAPPDTPYWSNVPFTFKQWAIFGEGTYHFNDQWGVTAGARWYNFDEDRTLVFAGVFSEPTIFHPDLYPDGKAHGKTSSDGVSPRVILSFQPNEDVLLTAQVARGFRLGGINDPLNVTLCTASDLATYDGHPDFNDETVTNYELGAKTQWNGGRVTLNGAVFYSDIKDLQVIADAGSCSSRIILNAQAESMGAELELTAHPSTSWDFGVSATYQKAEITKTRTDVTGVVLAGIRDGNQLPTSPEFQGSLFAQFNFPFSSTMDGFVNVTGQYVGSSWTQLADQEPPFGCVGCPGAPGFFPFGDPTISSFTFPAELPSYQIGNLRFGLRSDSWEAALYVNNISDERAFLSLDRERGTRARVGYLTNMPRVYGLNLHFKF